MNAFARFLPFLKWFPMGRDTIKADLLAGITVALVLIPQSMAYAQLAGLPAYYGLYAAFLPVAVAALWGSSAQLATGPVAVVSLLTASALAPLAAPGSGDYIALAIMLALLVGLVQLALGVFKLGVVVNFLSHPVIVGFSNAAAIIIGLSQLNKIFGVSMGRSEHFIQDIWGVLLQIGDTHIPTFIMGVSAFALMFFLRKKFPKLPAVLIAVAITTIASYAIGFEKNASGKIEQIMDAELQALVKQTDEINLRAADLAAQAAAKSGELKATEKSLGKESAKAAALAYQLEMIRIDAAKAEEESGKIRKQLRRVKVVRQIDDAGNTVALFPADKAPAGIKLDDTKYQIRKVAKGEFKLQGGGEVVGGIPSGLPSLAVPKFSWDTAVGLLSAALVISLVGFMEAISIAKAMAAKTKQRIDPNQELVGQGLANIVGSISQAYPASGSFSRSAVNLNAGALTGMSSVFTAIIVLATLLFLTPLLYHLPQAVLAAIIMLAVTGLINFKAIKHAWHAHKHDGIAAIVSFVATLGFAPHLDNGIMVGAGLALILYLYRTMKPRVAILGRHTDGTLRDVKVYPDLQTSKEVVAIRFDGSLYFANVSYFEDAILEAHAGYPDAKYILVVGDGINQLDASGEEVIHHLVDRLKANGVTLVFSGLKRQVLEIMENTGLRQVVGEENIFATEDMALDAVYRRVCEANPDAELCLLRRPEHTA
jgi:SulP family sulfate permease